MQIILPGLPAYIVDARFFLNVLIEEVSIVGKRDPTVEAYCFWKSSGMHSMASGSIIRQKAAMETDSGGKNRGRKACM